MPTIPDSNVLLDLINAGENWVEWSRTWFSRCSEEGVVITNAVIFAEASAQFADLKAAMKAIALLGLDYEGIPEAAAHAAGKAHLIYRERGGTKSRTLPDFLIGAHAAANGHRILTRDAARYRTYFPSVDIIAPDTHP
jgi:predicted nucleic acid-binding protein